MESENKKLANIEPANIELGNNELDYSESKNTDIKTSQYNELVSVVMPVYNGEDYIAETVKCVLDQTYRNIELVIVDDGSTDNTADIVKVFAEEDSRIKYYYREKSNAGVQRNYGFKQSNGEFLLFLDSDDLFERDLVFDMLSSIIKDNAQICICNADQYDTEKNEYIEKPQYLRMNVIPDKRPFSREDLSKYYLYFTSLVPWNKMIKRSFMEENGLYFQDIERANDQYFSILALTLAKKITITDKVLVHYRVKQKGNLTTEFSDTPLSSYNAMKKTADKLKELGLFEEEAVRCAFDNKVLNIMIFSLHIQKNIEGFKTLYNTLKNEGLDRLGLKLMDEDYYIDPLEYDNLKLILDLDYDEYILVKNREYRDVIAKKNQSYKNMVAKKNEKIAELKEKEKELNAIKRKNWYQKITKFIDRYHKLIGKED